MHNIFKKVILGTVLIHQFYQNHLKRVKEVSLQVAAVSQSLVKALPGLVQDPMAMLVF